MNPYETPKLVDEYLLFHYGEPAEILPYPDGPVAALGFAQRSVTEMVDVSKTRARVLDLGCAVGRSSFELSKFSASVLGVDYSKAFIEAAERLRLGETLDYRRLEEGGVTTSLHAQAHPEPIQTGSHSKPAMPWRSGRIWENLIWCTRRT